MRLFHCLVILCWLTPLRTQDAFFARLAEEVCSCMERFSVEPVNRQAINCMREVALANEEALRSRFGLVVREPSQRDILADRLAGDLLRNCPLLATLNYEREEERRWSDKERPPAVDPPRFSSPKGPPPDPADSITGEPPPVWLAEGSVQRLGSGKMLLRLTSGQILELELPAGISRLRRIRTGDFLRLAYRREWRKGERRIVNVVLQLEE